MPDDSTPKRTKPIKPIAVEPMPKRIRIRFNGETIADSLKALVMMEPGHRPVYYFPRDDVRMDMFQRTDHHSHCPHKGDASYWSITVGDRQAENAAWSYEDPIPNVETAKDHVAFYWDRVDSWLEEDEEVFVHPRSPHVRVDIRQSSRSVRVELAGEILAESRNGRFLFETGHKTRYYLPPEDIRMDLLVPSETSTACPYKGTAIYYSAKIGDRLVEDVAWSYPEPFAECTGIKGYLCFYDDRIDALSVDGGLVA